MEQVYPLAGGSQCLVAIGVNLPDMSFRIINIYNPTPSFALIPILDGWLGAHNNRSLPSFICLNSNLHHPHWNPCSCRKKEPEATTMLSLYSSAGYWLLSPGGTPTFFS